VNFLIGFDKPEKRKQWNGSEVTASGAVRFYALPPASSPAATEFDKENTDG
jgi:uncharacterized membrane protein